MFYPQSRKTNGTHISERQSLRSQEDPAPFLFSFPCCIFCQQSAGLLILSLLAPESEKLEAWELYFLEYEASKFPSLDSASAASKQEGRQKAGRRQAEAIFFPAIAVRLCCGPSTAILHVYPPMNHLPHWVASTIS